VQNINKLICVITVVLAGILWTGPTTAQAQTTTPPDSTSSGGTDIKLPFPFKDEGTYSGRGNNQSGLFMKRPSNISTEIEYDPKTGTYVIKDKIGDFDYRTPISMDMEEFRQYDLNNSLSDYWKERSDAVSSANSGLNLSMPIGGEAFDRIFGSNTVDIRPQGSVDLQFYVKSQKREDPSLNANQQRVTNFQFDQNIQMNVIAKIGDKIEFNTNYNTEATFDFENKLKLKYEGEEDEIIQLIEAGDVTLPLNSTLITGSQSLFGLKTQLQFGKATVTAVYSEQKSQASSITLQGGAQTSRFQLKADEYEENKHFFLGHTFRDHPRYGYEAALENLPIVNSAINITKIEVWITTRGPANENNRNILALADLGENSRINFDGIMPVAGEEFPRNESNTLFQYASDTSRMRSVVNAAEYLKGKGFAGGQDFELVGLATRLDPTEYSFNPYLGFISLNLVVPTDAVLAVAYQYQVIGSDEVYQVGEFSDEGISGDKNLFVKLLKPTSVNTDLPLWDLMMKNVYSIGGYQINRDDFTLNVLYSGNNNGIPTGYLNEGPENVNGIPLIRVMGLDNLDTKNDLVDGGDGLFDFVDGAATGGGTINSRNGRIYFPSLEPFGEYIKDAFGSDEDLGDKYSYEELYRLSKTQAQQYPKKNKFLIEGMYKSSSGSEVSLNALNIPEGSVKVSAGGIQLVENQDYTVDYTLGRVRIINESILNSGTPINISLESQNMFGIIQQRLMGAHLDYKIDDDFNLGATILNLHEKPITFKTNFGDEPISNTIWGIDGHIQKESRLLTKLIDGLPLIETKEVSRITADAEFAQFIPGHPNYIGEEGRSYIDDFEGAAAAIDFRNVGSWSIASVPQEQESYNMFPEGAPGTGRKYGYNRAKTAWYMIDPAVFYNGGITPPNIDTSSLSNHYARNVQAKELFPGRDFSDSYGTQNTWPILNVAYYPEEKGPYNYDVEGAPGYSAGVNEDGTLKDPASRWGGIMRKVESTDFEAANVEYIEFWMLDPFIYDKNHEGGDLYFNLGEISEDILRDGIMSFENGLPGDGNHVESSPNSIWGYVPTTRDLTSAFDNQEASRQYQDVGYDGLTDEGERVWFDDLYLSRIASQYGTSSQAYQEAFDDPSNDNYHNFRGGDYDQDTKYKSILERYKDYNNPHGNSPTDAQNPEDYVTSYSNVPNKEDINQDNTLTSVENYYQYRISLRPEDMVVGENYITDVNVQEVALANGDPETTVRWYQFKVPVKSPDAVIGNIQGFKSIRFVRMFFKNFEEEIVCRFGSLEFVRSEWRRYEKVLLSDGEYVIDEDNSSFDLSSVNIEENGTRDPIPYLMPPGLEQEYANSSISTTATLMNEQSMVMEVCDLEDGVARAAYKTTDFDFRQYEKLQMYLHAEKSNEDDDYKRGDLSFFIRLGADFTENYYEYEIPLSFSDWESNTKELIWPEENNLELEFSKLIQLKKDRTAAMEQENSVVTTTLPFTVYDGENKMTIRGVPNIGDVKVMMLGIRNPKRENLDSEDDGLPKCAEIWLNELRLTDFNDESGWAATGRIRATLADVGDVTLSGLHSTPGFGSIDKKINERQQETITQVDVATNIDLGKLTPEESGWRIPLHFDYSERTSNPKYNPLDPDILYGDAMEGMTDEEKEDYKEATQEYTRRRNLNLINVRKERVGQAGKKPKPYDIENFDMSYAYSELYQRDVDIEFYNKKEYSGGLGYNFSLAPKNIRPFKKSKLFKAKAFKIIKDFNFYTMPKLFSFRTDMKREYSERKMRSKSIGDIKLNTNYIKDWEWRRNYDFKYDLTRGLKLNYTADANAWIHEPAGVVDRSNKDEYQVFRDSVMSEILGFGSMNRYTQDVSVQYNVPINKIPIFAWINMNASYNSTYMWQASAKTVQERLGNTVENSRNVQVNTSFRMQNLYNMVPYLKQLNRGGGNRRGNAPKPPRSRSKGDDKGKEEEVSDTTKQRPDYFKIIGDNTLKLLMMVKDGSITYSDRNGTALPGFMPEPDLFGNNFSANAPGWGFVFGWEDDIRYEAAKNGWITTDSLFNNAYMVKNTKDLRIRAKLEPIKNFKIDLTAVRTEAFNHTSYFVADEVGSFFDSQGNVNEYSAIESGSFSMSFMMLQSAFDSMDTSYNTASLTRLKEGRMVIAERLSQDNPWYDNTRDSVNYPSGYGATSQDVLIPALLAAYTNTPANKISLNPFPSIPLPNWNIQIRSLNDIEALKKYFKSINISHAYQSDYTIGSWQTNVKYKEKDGYPYEKDQAGNFYSERQISVVSLKEQFNPLIGINVMMVNQSTFRAEIKKGRDLSLSFVNNQITDVTTNEYVIGFGYRFKDVKFNINSRSGKKQMKSDLNVKFDFTLQDQKVLLRQLDAGGIDIPSRGRQQLRISSSAEYTVNQKLNVRLFYEQNMNTPFVANQYPSSESRGGLSLRYTLTN
jgi:cell surface protein SprA